MTKPKVFFMILIVCSSFYCCAQSYNLSLGMCKSNTSWKTSELGQIGTHTLQANKYDFAISIGREYNIKPKSFMTSNLSYYQSGGALNSIDTKAEGADRIWRLENGAYDINTISLFTNYNMEIWGLGDLKLFATGGGRIDYILDNKKNVPVGTSPLQQLYDLDALNRFNFGPNIGLQLKYYTNSLSYSVIFTSAPRMRKLGFYKRDVNEPRITVYDGLSVREKVSFMQLCISMDLKS
jgi:hypothetical protein